MSSAFTPRISFKALSEEAVSSLVIITTNGDVFKDKLLLSLLLVAPSAGKEGDEDEDVEGIIELAAAEDIPSPLFNGNDCPDGATDFALPSTSFLFSFSPSLLVPIIVEVDVVASRGVLI